jgi:hypothetical protein
MFESYSHTLSMNHDILALLQKRRRTQRIPKKSNESEKLEGSE